MLDMGSLCWVVYNVGLPVCVPQRVYIEYALSAGASCGTHTGSPTLYVTQHREPMSNIIHIIYAHALSLPQETHRKDANIIWLNYLVVSKGMVGLPVDSAIILLFKDIYKM